MEFSKVIKWKRFSHSPYAVFCSIHKVINIGVLSVAVIANADAKSNKEQEPEENPAYYEMLDDVEVTAEQEGISINGPDIFSYKMELQNIQTAPQQSVNDLLKQVPEIDVRQRGANGIQTDISIKGATSEQTGITLNGISIASPQTGHLSADFPLSIEAIKRIELIEGEGENETINLVTKTDTINLFQSTAAAGLYGFFHTDNLINIRNKKDVHLINGSFSRSDGATLNSDFNAGKLYYFGATQTSPVRAEWQMGYSRKSFGANTFYSPAYDNQWERTNRLLTSAKIETTKPVQVSTQLSWNRDYDHFQLIRNEHFGENHHRTDALSIAPEIKQKKRKQENSIKVYYRHEKILSTNLGTPLGKDSVKIFGAEQFYQKRQSREIYGALLTHRQDIRRWHLDLGLHYTHSQDLRKRDNLLPFFKISYGLDHTRFILSLNNSVRIPSFTELFYKSPTNQGNVDLNSEKKRTIQLKAKHHKNGFHNEVMVFHTRGKEMIDWVMYHTEDTYHSANFGLRNIGICYHGELDLSRHVRQVPVKLGLGYQHIWQKREDDIFIYKSLYALEYLRNKATASVSVEPLHDLIIRFDTRLIDRIGNYILYKDRTNTGIRQAYEPYCISDLEINYQLKRAKLFATINNLFNKKYIDYGNVVQPGICGQVGITLQVAGNR